MNPRHREDGPDEPQEWPCQNCREGQVPARSFAKYGTRDCEECDGTGWVDIAPDDWDDTRDHDPDPTLLYDDVDHDYGRNIA